MHNIVPEVLLNNPEKSKKVWNELKKKRKKEWKPKDHDHFGKLELWMRKWISEAFVGIISHEELLYIYDILFMHHWRQVLSDQSNETTVLRWDPESVI